MSGLEVLTASSSRRQFMRGLGMSTLALLGSACDVLPLVRTGPRMPRIGYLSPGPRAQHADEVDAFVGGLRDLGYIDGQSIEIEWRFTPETNVAPWRELADDLVRQSMDVIVTVGLTPAALAAKQATTSIPIVFAGATGPVETGIVPNLAHPGGNVTGLSSSVPGVEAKYLEFLRDVVPGMTDLADILPADNPGVAASFERLRAAAEGAGVRAERVDLHTVDDLQPAFGSAAMARAQALFCDANGILSGVGDRFAELALQHRMPVLATKRAFADAGLLMVYGPDFLATIRRAATYVDKILRGANPGDIPVEQPTVFNLVVNVRTANALGLSIPESLLIQATQVIR